jgi:hypothetical protein
MDGASERPTWSTWRELIGVVTFPRHLKRTVTIALLVGTAFFAMNQLPVVLAGAATALVWFKVGLTYLTPLCMSNFGIASATRRPREVRKPGVGGLPAIDR